MTTPEDLQRKGSGGASWQADELQARLHKRPEQLDREAQISALLPVVMGGLVVVPAGQLAKIAGRSRPVAAQAVEAAVR